MLWIMHGQFLNRPSMKYLMKKNYLNFFLLSLIISCTSDNQTNNHIQKYLYLGHIYHSDSLIDNRISSLALEDYDQIWLGGDLCSETTASYGTLEYLDEIFDLNNPNTHWTLGNHDIRNGNLNWIKEKTGRPFFYSNSFQKITLIVLNTFFFMEGMYDTINMNFQYEMVKNICDTIENNNYLVVLMHGMMWKNIPGLDSAENYANTDCSHFIMHKTPDMTFSEGIYPLLRQVQHKGIEVICISGDFGQKQTSYEANSEDNIIFIGSGITSNTPYHSKFPSAGQDDKYLELEYNTLTDELSWVFKKLQ